MGWESPCSPSTSPAGGVAGGSACMSTAEKRSRDPEDEIYVDNLHNHKRYLSEIMASSLNGLTVGDTLADNVMESPSRSEGISFHQREEFSMPYSPMSEDSDDCRFCEIPVASTLVQSDMLSRPTSPVSPHRHQKPLDGMLPANTYPLPGCSLPAVICSHLRHRGSDTEARFPSSPNDMCHTADLRRTALLRSVQMRTQSHCSPTYEISFSGQDNMQSEEESERHYSCLKSIDSVIDYQSSEQAADDFVEEHSSVEGLSDALHIDEEKC